MNKHLEGESLTSRQTAEAREYQRTLWLHRAGGINGEQVDLPEHAIEQGQTFIQDWAAEKRHQAQQAEPESKQK
jgi:hypothetical protein